MSVRQQTYEQRFTIGPEDPASAIAAQEVALDAGHVLTVQWLDDARWRFTVWSTHGGMRRRSTGAIVSAAAGTTFLSTLTAAQPV
jgi:hypothetical protein